MKKLITLFAIGLLSGAVGAGWFTDTYYEKGYDLGVEEGYNSSLCSRRKPRAIGNYSEIIYYSEWYYNTLMEDLKLKDKSFTSIYGDPGNIAKGQKGYKERMELRKLANKIRNIKNNYGKATTYKIGDSNVSEEEYNDFRDGFKKGYKFGKTKCKIEE